MHVRRLLALAAAFALAIPAVQAQPLRESTGQRRADLDKMELQTVPTDVWSKLSNWTGGDALSAASIGGKPVLIVAWASWSPASIRAISTAQKIADKFGPQGLIVVGAHHPQGWADAAEAAKKAGAKFVMAHDASGDFRKALKIDHDPEFYLIDRAGHLRYAAIAAQSVDEACAELIGETAAQANDVPALLKKRADEQAALGRKTQEIRPDIDLASLPAVPPGYATPSEVAYRGAGWPKMDQKIASDVGLTDPNSPPGGKLNEVKFSMQAQGWYPSRPELQGRAMVVYLWHPDFAETYAVMPKMDLLQKQYRRDLAVIGALIPRKRIDNQFGSNPQDEESAEKLTQRYRTFIGSRDFAHALAADPTGSSVSSFPNGKVPIPGAIVVSSDGIIRWVGSINSPGFRYAVETVVAEDPGIRARRQADRAYIENRKR